MILKTNKLLKLPLLITNEGKNEESYLYKKKQQKI